MIKVKDGTVTIEGSVPDVLSEMSVLISSLHEMLVENADFPDALAKETVNMTFRAAYMSEADLIAETAKLNAQIAAMEGIEPGGAAAPREGVAGANE